MRLVQLLLEIVTCPFVEHEHGFALTLCLLFLVGEFLFLDLDVIFAGQIAQSFGIAELLVLHDEIDRTATLAASKAFADTLGTGHVKRRPAVVVERAQTNPVGTAFLETHEVAYHIDNVGSVKNLLYSIVVNHLSSVTLIVLLCRAYCIGNQCLVNG